MTLYAAGHPARDRAIDDAFQELHDLQAAAPHALFTFLGDEIVFGNLPVRELKAWDWSHRLAQAGIQRLEFADRVSRDEFEGFLDDVLARLTLSAIDTSETHQLRRSSIRFGSVGVKGDAGQAEPPVATATISYSLGEEAETVRWFQDAVKSQGVVRSEEHTSELQSQSNLVCRLLLEKKKKNRSHNDTAKHTQKQTMNYSRQTR